MRQRERESKKDLHKVTEIQQEKEGSILYIEIIGTEKIHREIVTESVQRE